MPRFVCAVLAAAVMAGCHVGPTTGAYGVARTASGAGVSLVVQGEHVEGEHVEGEHVDGELLAVRDSSLLVLRSRQVLLVPYWTIISARFTNTGSGLGVNLADGRAPTAEQAERLRLVSRFPQGVSPELEQRLLAAYGQSALIVAGR
jgi:hypothetical protein